MALDFWFVTHTSEVSHPQKKKVVCCTESQLGKKRNKNLIFPYPSHFPFFFSPESALPALGARSKLTEVKESFLMVSIRRTLDTSGYILQKYAFRP